MAGNAVEVNDANFQSEVAQSPLPTLVDFWAPWCGPCRMVAPIVEELAKEYSGKLKVAKINVDDSPGIASRFGIQSIPTLMVFKGGKPVERIVGAVMRQTLREAVDKHV